MIRPILRDAPAPAITASVAFAAGIWAGGWSLSGEALAIALAAFAGAAALRTSNRIGGVFLLLAFMAAGFVSGRERLAKPAEHASRALLGLDRSQSAEWTGRVEGFWTPASGGRFAPARIASVRQGGVEVPFGAPATLFVAGGAPIPVRRGDEFTVPAAISLPDLPASNRDLPQPFIEYALSSKSALSFRRIARTPLSWVSLPDEWLGGRLDGTGLPSSVREPVAALLLGRSASLDAGLVEDFRRGGMLHILVISGLQIALIAGVIFAALGGLPVSRRTRDVVTLTATIALAAAVGGRIPVMRAALTIGIFLASRILEKPVAPLQAVGLSALSVLLLDPSDLWRPGFFISYGAAVGISVFGPIIAAALRPAPALARIPVAAALSAQAAIAPLVLWRFNRVSLLSWIAAPVVVPIAAALLAIAAAILCAAAAGLPAGVFASAFSALERLLRLIAQVCGRGTFLAATPSLLAIATLLVFLGIASRRATPLRILGLSGYIVLLGVLAFRPVAAGRACDFSVEALDVGQGDAFLLRAGRSAFLIDGGGRFDFSAEEFGRTHLLPKLLDRGVVRLDGMMLSHPHPDHALGLFALLREMPLGTLYLGEGRDDGELWQRLEDLARSRSIPVRRLHTGDRIDWGAGRFEILRSGGRIFKLDPINNESIVASFARGGRRVLFTGDAGAPAEQDLLNGPNPLSPVDIVKIGHHGSRSSSTPDFLRALAPKAAILSCGRNNRFGHPAPQTLAALSALRIPLFRTDLRSDVGFAVTRDHLFLFAREMP